MERVMGIEPTCSAWKADILPLNYTRGFPETITLYPFRTRLSITIFRNFFAPRLQDIEERGKPDRSILYHPNQHIPGLQKPTYLFVHFHILFSDGIFAFLRNVKEIPCLSIFDYCPPSAARAILLSERETGPAPVTRNKKLKQRKEVPCHGKHLHASPEEGLPGKC